MIKESKQKFCLYAKGNIPVLLTAPHAGVKGVNNLLPGGKRRKTYIDEDGDETVAKTGNDGFTRDLVEGAYDYLAGKGMKPYVLITTIDRGALDLNRTLENNILTIGAAGISSGSSVIERLASIHQYFYEKALSFANEIMSKSTISSRERALHLDIHRAGSVPQGVEFGTGKNKPVADRKLIYTPPAAIPGFYSVSQAFKDQNFSLVSPLAMVTASWKDEKFNGNLTKATGKNTSGINSILVEFAKTSMNTKSKADQIAVKLGKIIENYVKNNSLEFKKSPARSKVAKSAISAKKLNTRSVYFKSR